MSSNKAQKRHRRRHESFSLYVLKVNKKVNPDKSISRKGMGVLNSFLNDTFDRIAREAAALGQHSQKHTLSSREIQTACKLILPGEIAKYAVAAGTTAMTKFEGSRS